MTSSHKRATTSPKLVRNARLSLDASSHASVDAALKDLKVCSRRLQVATVFVQDEARVLERLYYKSKNQHRSALFWGRVCEARRYSRRLQELHLSGLLENLRCAFFNESASKDPQVLRGAWTHYPDAGYINFVLLRISASSVLLKKMQARLSLTYGWLVASMRSGYFIQLLVMLVAVVSRIAALLPEIYEVLESIESICRRLLLSLVNQLPMSSITDTTVSPHTTVESPEPNVFKDLATPRTSPTRFMPLQDSPELIHDEGSFPAAQEVANNLDPAAATSDVSPFTSSLRVVHAPAVPAVKQGGKDGKPHAVVKKKRKKRHEIDEIFGF